MEVSGVQKSPGIKSPTSFKSRIPQKIDSKIVTSPTGRFQSRIPRSTSLKYNSPVKNVPEVIVQRQLSEPAAKISSAEGNCEFQSKIVPISSSVKSRFTIDNVRESVSCGKSYSGDELVFQDTGRKQNGDAFIFEENHINENSHQFITSATNTKEEVPAPQVIQPENSNSLDSNSSHDTASSLSDINSHDSNQKYIIIQPIYLDIQQQLSSDTGLTSTPSSKSESLASTTKDLEYEATEDTYKSNMDTKSPTTTTDKPSELPKNGFSKLGPDFPDEDFERTEHDNDDYTTTTTTEFEKDGKVVRTTETVNYTTDRNIKTRVITTEKIVTIPYGQQLDLSNPEITSSTTVRSKYLQTMLQNREFEGDKEVKAETLETIETDVQTDKVDSNDNTNDPDLDTVLTIVETLDEVRTVEAKVRGFSGTTAEDPVYTEVIEILNRSLSKFENIDPKGKASVEQKRKNGIEYIQRLIQQLNSKLQENRSKIEPTNNATAASVNGLPSPVDEQPPKIEKASLNEQKPLANEPDGKPKKERKSSTLKNAFKIGNKEKKSDEQKEKKKKKKKLCVIS